MDNKNVTPSNVNNWIVEMNPFVELFVFTALFQFHREFTLAVLDFHFTLVQTITICILFNI